MLTTSTHNITLMLTMTTLQERTKMEMAMTSQNRVRAILGRWWATDRPLTAVGVVMIAVFAASVIGIVVDPRTITGMPAWLKPAKFAASTAIYSLTLAWIFSYLPDWPRVRRTAS